MCEDCRVSTATAAVVAVDGALAGPVRAVLAVILDSVPVAVAELVASPALFVVFLFVSEFVAVLDIALSAVSREGSSEPEFGVVRFAAGCKLTEGGLLLVAAFSVGLTPCRTRVLVCDDRSIVPTVVVAVVVVMVVAEIASVDARSFALVAPVAAELASVLVD